MSDPQHVASAGWQPIATAPKDVPILVIGYSWGEKKHPRASIVHWTTDRLEYWELVNDDTQKRRVEESGHWSPIGTDDWLDWEITHWMPRPDPTQETP